MKVMVTPVVTGALDTVTKEQVQRQEDSEIREVGIFPKYRIIEIGQNTEKCPGDVMRRALSQTPVKDHHTNADVKKIPMSLMIIIIIIHEGVQG